MIDFTKAQIEFPSLRHGVMGKVTYRGIELVRVGTQWLCLRQLCNTSEEVDSVIDEALQKLNDSIKPTVNY